MEIHILRLTPGLLFPYLSVNAFLQTESETIGISNSKSLFDVEPPSDVVPQPASIAPLLRTVFISWEPAL